MDLIQMKTGVEKMKDKYIEYAKKTFEGNALDIVLNQIDLFYKEDKKIEKNKYTEGENVYLEKGTFIHGIFPGKEIFDYTVENGFIAIEFSDPQRANKIKNSVGMWNLKEDTYLKDYIYNYSGFTITYTIGRGPESKLVSELVPYHKFDEVTEKINDLESVWQYWGDKTKEVSFIPSLVSNKRQIAFILNMKSEYAKELIKADVWNTNLDEETLKPFLDYRYYEKFLDERFNRTKATADRESAIIFGLPKDLIEGVLVGRQVEHDEEKLKYIKSKLNDSYICNLDGKVIVGNK